MKNNALLFYSLALIFIGVGGIAYSNWTPQEQIIVDKVAELDQAKAQFRQDVNSVLINVKEPMIAQSQNLIDRAREINDLMVQLCDEHNLTKEEAEKKIGTVGKYVDIESIEKKQACLDLLMFIINYSATELTK